MNLTMPALPLAMQLSSDGSLSVPAIAPSRPEPLPAEQVLLAAMAPTRPTVFVPVSFPASHTPAQGTDEIATEKPHSDPQQLLDLLLGIAVREPVAELPPLPGMLAPLPQPSIMPQIVESLSAGAGSVLMAGSHAKPRASPAIAQSGINLLPAVTLPPLKLTTSADALLASKTVQQQLLMGTKSGVQPVALQYPAAGLIDSLLNQQVVAERSAPLALPQTPCARAEVLQQVLTERLELQIGQRKQQATIRLDPPHLGKLDISIQYEAGKIQIQIHAAQPEVTRLLQQISAEMRASLSEQHNQGVNLEISSYGGDSRQQQKQQQSKREQPETANASYHEELVTLQRGSDDTILTMV